MNELLIPAIRQYRHNDNTGLLIGYNKKEVDRILSDLPLVYFQYRYLIRDKDWSSWKSCCEEKYKSITKDVLNGHNNTEARGLIVRL